MSAPEIRTGDLAQRLAEAEATIAALLEGQIDAVVDTRSRSPVLLSKAQEALRQSEERYRRIVETTREGVWMLDAAHKTAFMNRRMAEMLGCELDRGLGTSPFDFLDGTRRRSSRPICNAPSRRPDDLRYTPRRQSASGRCSTARRSSRAGRYEGSLAMVVDSPAQAAEIALRHERDRAASYLANRAVIRLAMDLNGGSPMIKPLRPIDPGWTSENGRTRLVPPACRRATRNPSGKHCVSS